LVLQTFEDLKQKKQEEREKIAKEEAKKGGKKRRGSVAKGGDAGKGGAAGSKRHKGAGDKGGGGREEEEERELTPVQVEALAAGARDYSLMLPSHDVRLFEAISLAPAEEGSALDMVESMKCLAMDYPACQLAADNAASACHARDYEALDQACELFSASLLFAKPTPGVSAATPPNKYQVDHIMNEAYRRTILNSNILNKYKGFSDEVYGEAGHDLITDLIVRVPITKEDVFLDLGSGIGQVVMQVAAQAQAQGSYGVELADSPATRQRCEYAKAMSSEFRSLMSSYNKVASHFELLEGSFLDAAILSDELLSTASIIFCNNVAFGPATNQSLLLRFAVCKQGTKIVSMRSFEAHRPILIIAHMPMYGNNH